MLSALGACVPCDEPGHPGAGGGQAGAPFVFGADSAGASAARPRLATPNPLKKMKSKD